jgi:hypothetical protein
VLSIILALGGSWLRAGRGLLGRVSGKVIVVSLPLGALFCFFFFCVAVGGLGGSVDRSVSRRNPKAEADEGQPVGSAQLFI